MPPLLAYCGTEGGQARGTWEEPGCTGTFWAVDQGSRQMAAKEATLWTKALTKVSANSSIPNQAESLEDYVQFSSG